jgi:AcrR family transcriptional regulator
MRPPAGPRPDDPRARAAQTKRDRTRRALLDAADATFASRTWAEARMEDIAATAGVSAATAYNHFPTKHALVGHVFGPLLDPLLVRARADADAGRPVVDALAEQVRELARTCYRNRRLTAAFWAAVREYTIRVGGPADPDDELDPRTLVPMPEPLRVLVEHGQRTGELRRWPEASEMARVVVNLLLLKTTNHPDLPPDATAELLLTVLFGALRPELLVDAGPDARPFRR